MTTNKPEQPNDANQIIGPKALCEISERTWQDPVYGEVALSILHYTGGITTGSVRREGSGMLRIHMLGGQRVIPAVGTNENVQRALRAARELIDSPFLLRARAATEADSPYGLREVPAFMIEGTSDIAPRSLATFMQKRAYDRHRLHGTFGKAFDVLGQATGKESRDPATIHSDEEYLGLEEIKARLTDTNLNGSQRQAFLAKIRDYGRKQLRYGQPTQFGEVVFEGAVHVASGGQFTYQKVAVSSLRMLADTYRAGSAVSEVIEQTFPTS